MWNFTFHGCIRSVLTSFLFYFDWFFFSISSLVIWFNLIFILNLFIILLIFFTFLLIYLFIDLIPQYLILIYFYLEFGIPPHLILILFFIVVFIFFIALFSILSLNIFLIDIFFFVLRIDLHAFFHFHFYRAILVLCSWPQGYPLTQISFFLNVFNFIIQYWIIW